MRRSEQIGKLAEALCKAQLEIGPAVFDSTNPHFRAKYASLASVMTAAKPAFGHGLSVTQSIEVVEGRVDVITVLMHTSGEWLETTISMKPKADSPQEIGSCATYGRRYGISAILGISSDEDDDANAATGAKQQAQAQKPKAPAAPAAPQPPQPKAPAAEAPKAPVAPPAEPVTPAAPAAPAETPEQKTGREIAAQNKRVRDLAIACGAKNTMEIRELISTLVGRHIESANELSEPERIKIIAAMEEQTNGKKG